MERSYVGHLTAKKHLKIGADTSSAGEFVADTGKLTQMLLNLLSNAIKFTPAQRTPETLEVGRQVIDRAGTAGSR